MKFKKGDVVTIKSLEWYENEKDAWGEISIDEGNRTFNEDMSELCGKKAKIEECLGEDDNGEERYLIDIDEGMWVWIDWMFEDNDEQQTENGEQQPTSNIIRVSKNYVLSDKIVSFDELEQLADNHKSVAWKHNDNTYTLKPAAIFLSWSYRLLKSNLPNLYNVVLNDKANIIGEELYKQGLVNSEDVQKVIDITRKILK